MLNVSPSPQKVPKSVVEKLNVILGYIFSCTVAFPTIFAKTAFYWLSPVPCTIWFINSYGVTNLFFCMALCSEGQAGASD